MEDVEINAIFTGLLVSVIVGACLIVATLINTARKRNRDARAQELFNLRTSLHPADDIYGSDFPDHWDDWPELEEWMKRNPEQVAQFERDAIAHREGRR